MALTVESAKVCVAAGRDFAPPLWAALSFHGQPLEAARETDGVLTVTEWQEYLEVNIAAFKTAMRFAAVFVGRNRAEPALLSAQGIAYFDAGRRASKQR